MKYCQTCQHCYEDAESFCRADGAALVDDRRGSPLLAGKYRLEVLLGRGDQGTAYEATEVGNGRPVIAVALLRGQVLEDPQSLERFHQAAQAAGRNNGQEVGEIRDSGSLPGGGAYVVMELIDEEADESEGAAVTAPGQTDTPTVASQAPTTGPLRPPGRNTGRLSKVAVELTQEVPRLPLPLQRVAAQPPTDTPDATPAVVSDVTQVISSPQPQVAPTHRTVPDVDTPPSPPIVVDIPRETARREGVRRRSWAFYLFLAFIGLVFVFLLTIAVSRLRREPAPAVATISPATQSTDSQAANTAIPAAQPNADSSPGQTGQTMPVAADNGSVPPVIPAGDGATTSASVSSRGASREAEVRTMLDDWVAAVAAQDVERLMAFYSTELDAFYNRREVSSASIRTELSRLYKRAERVDVRVVGEPRITFDDGGRLATVRLRLGYTVKDKEGKTRRGEATQELRLAKSAEGWKIKEQRGENMLR